MITDITATITVLIAVLVAAAGYVRFVLLRATVGAAFDVELTSLGPLEGTPVADLSCIVTNLGSNLLEVTRIRVRVRYSMSDGASQFTGNPLEPALSGKLEAIDGGSWIIIYPPPRSSEDARTVVFQGGTQAYRMPLRFAGGTGVVSVWASCNYRVRVSGLTRRLVRLVLNPPADLDFTRGVGNHQVRRTGSR